jgi:anaerobic selenocysteine-containing dehydrogenase
MRNIERRTFLGSAGLAAAAAACRARPDPYAARKPPVRLAPGVRPGSDRQMFSTCGLCSAGCGLRVRVVDGRAVKVDGNPHSPINRGGLCARGAAALDLLYHPDRVRGPMVRSGPRGGNRWLSVSWDEAIARLAGEIGKLRTAGTPEALVVLDGQESGTTHALWRRFLRAFGSPNHVGHGATGNGALARAMADLTGVAGLPGYDFENARLVLLVGTGALESSPQAMTLARAVGRGARPRLLCAWPRLPPAAALVDEWLPLRPGGEASLLLALAHVLLREGLADESRLQGARGFEAEGNLRDRILTGCSPQQTEAATGIAARRVERLALELAAIRPSVVAPDEMAADGVVAVAALVLNALLGGFDAPGGVRREPDWAWPAWSAPTLDGVAERGLRMAALDGHAPDCADVEVSRILGLPAALVARKPYAAQVLLLHHSNPVFSKPGGVAWRQALEAVPFVVSFSPLLDESALGADLVLPEPTFLERWDVVLPGRATRTLSWQQPVVRPLGDTLATGEVILRLAAALGGSVAEAMPWRSYRQAVEAGLAKLPADLGEILAKLEGEGAWVAPPAAADLAVGWRGQGPRLLDVRGAIPAVLPAPEGEAAGFPFLLVPFRGTGYAEGGIRHLPYLRELPLARGGRRPVIEMATLDARNLGVRDGDPVVVESAQGSLAMAARVHAGLCPGTLGLPLGLGPWPVVRAGQTSMDLLAGHAEPRTGHWLACATHARVRKAG